MDLESYFRKESRIAKTDNIRVSFHAKELSRDQQIWCLNTSITDPLLVEIPGLFRSFFFLSFRLTFHNLAHFSLINISILASTSSRSYNESLAEKPTHKRSVDEMLESASTLKDLTEVKEVLDHFQLEFKRKETVSASSIVVTDLVVN